VHFSRAAYSCDESLNKREKFYAIIANNVFKYSFSILAIITNDISKYEPALFRQRISSNTVLHRAITMKNIYRYALAHLHFQIKSCHNST
jgi:hypothetical protein